MSDKYKVLGGTSLSGKPWVNVSKAGTSVWVTPAECTTPKALKDALAREGIVVATTKQVDALLTSIENIEAYPHIQLADEVGWNGDHYRCGSGDIISPSGLHCETVDPVPLESTLVRGSVEDWHDQLARVLPENPVSVFSVALPFVGPLLRFSPLSGLPAFELVAPAGTGKSTHQRLASSVIGQQGPHLDTHAAAVRDPVALARTNRDGLLILDSDDRAMVASAPAKRQNAYSAIDKQLAGGDHGYHLCLLSSSQQPLYSLLGARMHQAAESQRILTITFGSDRPHGVFDDIPDGFESGGELADFLRKLSSEQFGKAYRHFLHWLVEEVQADSEGLNNRITMSLEKFRTEAEVDGSDGEAKRRADIFGMVYVAALFGRRSGALPSGGSFNAAFYRQAVLSCYQLHLGTLPSEVPFGTRLLDLAKDPRTYHVPRKSKKPPNEARLIQSAPWFVRTRDGKRQLLVRECEIRAAFSDWPIVRHRLDAKQFFIIEAEHHRVKRTIRGVDLGRVFAFVLPDDPGAGWEVPTG